MGACGGSIGLHLTHLESMGFSRDLWRLVEGHCRLLGLSGGSGGQGSLMGISRPQWASMGHWSPMSVIGVYWISVGILWHSRGHLGSLEVSGAQCVMYVHP